MRPEYVIARVSDALVIGSIATRLGYGVGVDRMALKSSSFAGQLGAASVNSHSVGWQTVVHAVQKSAAQRSVGDRVSRLVSVHARAY